MKFKKPISLSEAAKLLDCKYLGDEDHLITGLNEIHRVESGDAVFVDVKKYYKKALNSAATTIIINREVEPPAGKALLISDDPFNTFNQLAHHFQPRPPLDLYGPAPKSVPEFKIGQNVTMGENVKLGKGVEIGHNTVIGSNVEIGDNTLIYPNVTIYDHCRIGNHCCIQAGAVIGSEAFYFKARSWGREKMQSVGHVVIENHVEIGANSTIDRGVSSVTRIGAHSKLDNLVQVGHDTLIGKRCVIAAQVGIAGCVTIEDEVMLWGQVGVVQDLTIGKGAQLIGKTGVMSDLEGGRAYGGIVADDYRSFLKKEAIMKRLVQIMPDIERLLKEA